MFLVKADPENRVISSLGAKAQVKVCPKHQFPF